LISVPDDRVADGLRADREFIHEDAHQRIKDRQHIHGGAAGLISEEKNGKERKEEGRRKDQRRKDVKRGCSSDGGGGVTGKPTEESGKNEILRMGAGCGRKPEEMRVKKTLAGDSWPQPARADVSSRRHLFFEFEGASTPLGGSQ
jgi:hypothetical protein